MNIFDVVGVIELDKRPWSQLDDEFKKTYSQFMINRIVSSKKQYLPLIAKLSTMKLSDEQHYTFLCSLVNKQKHYFDYKSYKQNKMLDKLTMYALEHELILAIKTLCVMQKCCLQQILKHSVRNGKTTSIRINNFKDSICNHLKKF